MFAPILWGDRTIGILTVQSYTTNKYQEKDLQDVQLFADQIGGALMRSRADANLLIQTNALLKSEQQLTGLLKEKDVLLKEVYHRTKNNMQVIVGLLDMQSYKTDNQHTLITLKEMTDRISSMGMVHDLLYRSKSLADIRLDTYLHKLVSRLVAAYQSPDIDIDTDIQVESLRINIQFAIPLGLVINEMVTNALKYAFPDRTNGRIRVVAKPWKDNGLELSVGDNGIGLQLDIDPRKTESLGMRIIHDIIGLQLLGEIKLNHKNGQTYQVKIPNINMDAKSV
jgi:two-component sensor histidine kinase